MGCHPSLATTDARVPSSVTFNTSLRSFASARKEFLLADIGEGIKEVELLQWFVAAGQSIQQFDTVAQVQSDKATVEITSRYDGVVLELAGQVGDMMQVGQPLLYIQMPAATTDDEKMIETTTTTNDEPLQIPTVASQYQLESDDTSRQQLPSFQASPAVRKLGAEYGIDLSVIQGSGPKGRLLKCDVMTYLKERGLWQESESLESSEDVCVPVPDYALISQAPSSPLRLQDDTVVALKGYSRLMVQSMTAALKIPHMGFGDELLVNNLLDIRKQLNTAASTTAKLSLLVFVVKAISLAMLEHPTINAQVHNEERFELQLKKDHDIGIAVDTPRGLVVPVLRAVQTKSLVELQIELDHVKILASESQLRADHVQNPTFTLSNIGSMGSGTYMQPVLVPPQLVMGALGRIQTLPRFNVSDDHVYKAHVMNVSYAADHRFLDGATLARFHAVVKRYVENPVLMLAHVK
jgi:2-oxoisovalerate dehydrogenase E2 component (dihydrolipoyl transacylase)